eukprot:176709-Pelagomonas_calceolata.AAC.2
MINKESIGSSARGLASTWNGLTPQKGCWHTGCGAVWQYSAAAAAAAAAPSAKNGCPSRQGRMPGCTSTSWRTPVHPA